MTTDFRPIRVGDRVTYYPRAGKPGREVTVIAIRRHVFHRYLIRFRYDDGREREVTCGKFHTSPG